MTRKNLAASTLIIVVMTAFPSYAQDCDLDINGGRVTDSETEFDAVANQPLTGDETIDATGLVVSPGFIDTHYHASNVFAKSQTKKNKHIFREHDHDPVGSPQSMISPTNTIKIPEKDTTISIHGFATLQAYYDTDDINNVEWVTGAIPVNGADSATHASVNMSRFEISSATPSEGGQLNTFLGMDFDDNGNPNSPELRLRQAYGELIFKDWDLSVLAGQDFATMIDMKAWPETLEYLGPAGGFNRRQALVRVTKSFTDNLTGAFAAETPSNAVYINADKRTRWPDLVIAGKWHPGGEYLRHLRLAGLVRDLGAEDINEVNDSALGWTIQATGKVMLPVFGEQDNLKFGINHGAGYGAQVSSGFDDAFFDTSSGELKTIQLFGAYGGLQHWWSEAFRANVVLGYLKADNPSLVNSDVIDSTSYGSANVIWVPFSNTMFGLEYLLGRRKNQGGEAGTASRYLFTMRYSY